MSTISQVANPLGGADQVVAVELVKGETHRLAYTMRDDDENILDVRTWRIAIANQWFLGSVEAGPLITGMDETAMNLGPGAELLTGNARNGIVEIVWPVGAYTGDVEPNETMDVPILASVVTIQNLDAPPRAVVHRLLAVYRWAP